MTVSTRPFTPHDAPQVIELWKACGLTRPWNPPERDITDKLKIQPELFIVLEQNDQIIGSVMAAFDGHRGSVNYLAVHPDHQRRGHAQKLMNIVESKLKAMGCPKINLMVRTDNLAVQEFYQSSDYEPQDVVVMGKWL